MATKKLLAKFDGKKGKTSNKKKSNDQTMQTVVEDECEKDKKKKKPTARKRATANAANAANASSAAATAVPEDGPKASDRPRGSDPPPTQSQTVPPPNTPAVAPIATNGAQVVQKWVQRALDTGVAALRDEYRGLAKYTLPTMTMEAFQANQAAGRNRYQDVPCQDQNRVVVKYPGMATDYVHANYVGTPVGAKRFICTQGPLDCTVNDFWCMVVQEKAETIVMLCNCVETGKLKCAQYWPTTVGETRKYEGINIEVTLKEARAMAPEEPTITLSVFIVKFGTESREVRHYQWLDWPDRGVPPCRLTSMELLSRIRGTKMPIIVHCSAGIGRTGTIVAIEYIMERMQAGVECATMGELLKELRDQRAWTIQNDLQYLYVHRVILCYFLEKHKARYESILTEENQAKYRKFIEEYNAATGT